MRCADVRVDLSALVDDELPAERVAAIETHVVDCAACASYRESLHRLRVRMLVEPVGRVLDLAPAVRERLGAGPPPAQKARRPLVSLAAAFVAAFVAGASFVGFVSGPAPVAARDLSEAVLRAQRAVESLQARLTVVEHNWHPAVPERRFDGTIVFRGPESLAVHLDDVTRYPSSAWVANDIDVVVDDAMSWERGPAACPREALPGCTPPTSRSRGVSGREPFAGSDPAPLDLVVPVRSFALGEPVRSLGTRRIAGRAAIGVRVSVGQVAPLLDSLASVGNWRPLHPTDVVELWLDEELLVPLSLTVEATDSPERREWAARRGFDEDDRVLSLTLSDVRVDATVADDAFAPPPPDALLAPAGFTDQSVVGPEPQWLPPGMRASRSGVMRAGAGPQVQVRSWSDGRAWLKVSTTTEWNGTRLFGDVGRVVREVEVADGLGYVDEAGERVALHADGIDVVVAGSVPLDDLERVAASLGVRGLAVPDTWDEAATATRLAVGDRVPGALLPPSEHAPACRIDGRTAICAFAGPGARGFRVAVAPGTRLGPPFDVDARVVEVRGVLARWSPMLRTLEWVEHGVVTSLASESLALDELVALAESMEPA